MKRGRPKRYSVAIQKIGARPDEEPRLVEVHAVDKDYAVRRLISKGLLDPKSEEIIGVQEIP